MLVYSSLSDHELADLLKKDDDRAFTTIYNRYAAALYVHAYNKLRNTEEAKDLIQELFAKLWSNRNSFSLTGNFSAYLYTSVRNRVFRIIERKGIESSYITSILSIASKKNNITDHRVREKLLQAMIAREINALPPKMKEIFILSRKANLSHREIGMKLGISEFTVKKQINNALKTLRVRLGLIAYLMLLMDMG